MTIYFAFFAAPLLLHFSQKSVVKGRFDDYLIFSLFAILVIGLRYATGGDWGNYYQTFQYIGRVSHFDVSSSGSKGMIEFSQSGLFWVLHYFEPKYGYFIYHALATGLGFFALYVFARDQPYFWLTISLAVPFFIIIMIMGYTRQGIALSFIMIGLYYLKRYYVIKFGIFVLIATTFHASAIVMSLLALPYIFHRNFRYKTALFSLVSIIAFLGMGYFQNYLEVTSKLYVEEGMISSGTLPRLLITVLAAAFFMQYSKRWQYVFDDYLIWRGYAFAAFVAISALAILPSTSVDRMALYLLPLQLAVWPRIIYLSNVKNRQLLTFGIIAGYGLTLYVWLNYAANVYMWLPFQHLFFVDKI